MSTAPDQKPFDSGFLNVSEIHSIYYAQHGNKEGKPVILIHGGPGGCGTDFYNSEFFDPTIFRIVLYDQRGAGKSLPNAEIRDNTSQLLVKDIETLRTHLSIPRWHIVFGGSWGSTLSLLYAQTHPEAMSSLVLRGIFLITEPELDWFYGNETDSIRGLGTLFPDIKGPFLRHLEEVGEDVTDPVSSYYRLLTHENPDVIVAAARVWAGQELLTSHLNMDRKEAEERLNDKSFLLSFARIEVSYFKHRAWLEEGQLLKKENLDRIRHIPTTIVQGRYDVVCPAMTAWKLYQALGGEKGKCEFHWTLAGHSATEPETKKKLFETCSKYGAMDFK